MVRLERDIGPVGTFWVLRMVWMDRSQRILGLERVVRVDREERVLWHQWLQRHLGLERMVRMERS